MPERGTSRRSRKIARRRSTLPATPASNEDVGDNVERCGCFAGFVGQYYLGVLGSELRESPNGKHTPAGCARCLLDFV